jgi:hypothetical protein
VSRPGTVPTGLAGALASLSFRLKPMFEEEARQRQVAGLRQGADFPVGENSPGVSFVLHVKSVIL